MNRDKSTSYSENIERYCPVIDSNTTFTRTTNKNGVSYTCLGCDKSGTPECRCKNNGNTQNTF